MRFEIVLAARRPETGASTNEGPTQADGVRAAPASSTKPEAVTPARLRVVHREARPSTHEALDIFIDGANVTEGVSETHGAWVLRDLAVVLADLAGCARSKGTVPFYDEPWEICVERFGATACLSVYRAGPDPQVAVYDRAVPFQQVVTAVRDAIGRLLAGGVAKETYTREIEVAWDRLRTVACLGPDAHGVPDAVQLSIDPDRDAPISFGAEFSMRPAEPSFGKSRDADTIERADLHALLFRGRMRAEIRGRTIDLGESRPLVLAERLLDLARRVFDSWERGLGLHARGEAAGILVGVRVATDGELALTLGGARCASDRADGPPRTVQTFPALGPVDFLDAALTFGRSLVRAVVRHDRGQSNNLRLEPLRKALREASGALRDASDTDSKVNASPEPYRSFAAALDEARPSPPPGLPAARLRYAPRWRAIVPGIDLRATYLCGDRVIAGSATEMWGLDRMSGRVLWRADAMRGTSVITPGGVARLASDGAMKIYDLCTGEISLRTRIAPRMGAPVAGAVVHLPGLPKLVIVTEGAHHLVAVDLTSGEPRWRWSWGRNRPTRQPHRGAPRLKRSGRLAYFTCGDGALTALDVMTGAVVWRLRDRLRFYAPPTIAHDSLFIVAGGAHGVARLYCADPFSGRVRWASTVGDEGMPCTVQGGPVAAASSVAVMVRQRAGLALAAFRREDGNPVTQRARVASPNGTSWLAVDDAFIGNAPTGELLAIDAGTGELRWRQMLGSSPLESDVPRRLEPVLRCGALFVPHTDVVVVRPRDGKVLGSISPTEVIPDLLRVDERCDVYAAEESGHIVCFGALPRLALVRP
jgi:outer membrane protein assembly factor BamB